VHISIVRPLGEGGKLQLTTDMTELEFAMNAFVVDTAHPQRAGGGLQALGDDYKMLRAMRYVSDECFGCAVLIHSDVVLCSFWTTPP
jgi:hypothetical protein